MKNYVFLFAFMLVGTFTFAQSSCSCESGGNSCSANCGQGSVATCGGADGTCSCNCVAKGPVIFAMNTQMKVNNCGIIRPDYIENVTKIKFVDINEKNVNFSEKFDSFKNAIASVNEERYASL